MDYFPQTDKHSGWPTDAVIYYTLDGSMPTTSSTLYTGAVYLASASTVRAVAFTNGWTPSVAAVAYYGFPAVTANAQVTRSVNTSTPTAPVVTFNVTPGTNASLRGSDGIAACGSGGNKRDGGRQLHRQQQRGACGGRSSERMPRF